jgi:GT2 family glycosyltransferase
MSSDFDVDVVILSWNRVADTVQSIESALSQVGVRVFVWVVDQGSEKEGLDSLKRATFGRKNVKICELGENRGVPGGRNWGIALGDSDIVVCLDNDAVFKDDSCLLKVVRQFQTLERLGVLGFRIENFFTNSISRSDWVYPRSLINRSFEPFLATRFCGAGHAIRRSTFEEVGGYDEKLFFYWEELDLSYKIINIGFDVAYDPSITVLHKVNTESRVRWDDQRYYFLVRNAIYIDWKHFRSVGRLVTIAAGYLVKGIYNHLDQQALKGIRDGLELCIFSSRVSPILSASARKYIRDNDLVLRGNFLDRIKREVLEKIS